jgi:hypothetical protein
MLNKKGYATIGIILSVLLVVLLISPLFFRQIMNTSVKMKEDTQVLPAYLKKRNAFERLHGMLSENNSLEGTVNFEDLEETYELETVAVELEDEVLNNELSFTINNATDIAIEFKTTTLGENPSYDVYLMLNGKIIQQVDDLTEDASINISNEFVYNKETGISNFGDYELVISNSNINVDTKISYSKLKFREVSVNNGEFNITIKDGANGKEVKFK